MANFPAGRTGTGQGPSAWIRRWLGRPGGSGELLDFASGQGRHVVPARAAGYRVTAVDRDPAALAEAVARGARAICADLEAGRWPLAGCRFEVVLMTRYLYRPRLALLAGLVEPGGRLLVETFARGNEAWGRPRNPAFLLAADELFDSCRRAGLHVLAFEQGVAGPPRADGGADEAGARPEAGPSVVQRIVAIRPPFEARAWTIDRD